MARAAMLRAVAVLGLVLALPSVADASPLLMPTGGVALPTRYGRWFTHSRVPLPRAPVAITFAACPGDSEAAGCADLDASRIWLLDRSQFVLFHELGHVFDAQYMTSARRSAYKRLVHMTGEAWFGMDDDPFSPGETFADAYSVCAFGDDGADPRICRLIRRAVR